VTVIHREVVQAPARAWRTYPKYRNSGVEWLGDIPIHWEVKPLKCLVEMNPDVLAEDTDPDLDLHYVDIGNIDSTGNILGAEELRFEDAPSRARRRVQDGDTVISTVRTYLRAIARIKEAQGNLIVSTGFAVLRPGDKVDSAFLFRMVQSNQFVETVVSHSDGVGYPAITPTRLGGLLAWLPPVSEQRTIARFLDKETRKVDALISKRERLIELLEEKRTALITRAVTKGLDPDVPMKDSGVEWIGEIPEHWDITRLQNVARSLQTGPFGSQLHSQDYVPGGIPVINPSHLTGGFINPDTNCAVDDKTRQRLVRHELREGDIVFARRGELGRCALVTATEEGWICGTGSLRVRPRKDISEPTFLNLTLSTPGVKDWLLLESVGATMDNLNTSILASLLLPLPPLSEQRDLITFIDQETTKINALVDKVREHIEKLREYRMALISAAVTGKIDVREET
jgi:type I restriction enzyme S subunit